MNSPSVVSLNFPQNVKVSLSNYVNLNVYEILEKFELTKLNNVNFIYMDKYSGILIRYYYFCPVILRNPNH